MKYLVLAVNPWRMTDEKSGLENKGVTVWYTDNQPIVNVETGKVGFFPIKITADYNFRETLSKAPAVYDIDFGMKPDSKGKPVLFVNKIDFVKQVDFISNMKVTA